MKKSSLYKLACIVDIIVIVAFFLFFLYETYSKQIVNVSGANIFILLYAFDIIGDVLGIRLANSFKIHRNPSKSFSMALFVFYIFTCLLFFLISYATFLAVKEIFSSYNEYINDPRNVFATLFIIILFFTSLIKVIYTWILVRALKKNNAAFLTSIDSMGTTA
jgi:hypothetical protein